jgi:hypothetical protein
MRTPTVAVLLTFLVLGCGSDSTAPDLTATSGNYVLRTINGSALPVTVLARTNFQLDITAETLFAQPSGDFTDVTHYRRDTLGVVDLPADTLGGRWTVRGSVVSFTSIAGNFEVVSLVGRSRSREAD